MTDRYLRLLAVGFRPKAAAALATAGYDVTEWLPFGWAGHEPLATLKRREQVAR